MRIILFFLLGILSNIGFSQSVQSNSRDPYPEQVKVYKPVLKKSKKKTNNLNAEFDRLVEDYYSRMKANVKKYKMMARKMKKPQYSDPSYFGHKRKPKKRKVGKRKLCKECNIVH